MTESGQLVTIHETLDPNDFDNAHPSSPFYVPDLPSSFDKLDDDAADALARQMGVEAAIRGDGRKDNPFHRSYTSIFESWNEGWLRETCGDNCD